MSFSFARFCRVSAVLLLVPLLGAWGGSGTKARREAGHFILETLRKQEGEAWERTGQFMIWTYGFDRSGCELTVKREADLADLFTQRIPLASAAPVGTQNSEIVFDCKNGAACVDYAIKNRTVLDEQRVARTRVLVMDDEDITPLMNAFAELHQLCRDPYSPARPR